MAENKGMNLVLLALALIVMIHLGNTEPAEQVEVAEYE